MIPKRLLVVGLTKMVKVILLNPTATLPSRGSLFAAGLDLHSSEDLTLQPGERRVVSTGIAMEIPHGNYMQLFSRSSLACKGLDVCGGVIDSDYRGEIKVILHNTSSEPYVIMTGNRIAQGVILRSFPGKIELVDRIDKTARDTSGFGSSGI